MRRPAHYDYFEELMIQAPSDARTVLRAFRYAELPHLLGRKVLIPNHDSIVDVDTAFAADVAPSAVLQLDDVRKLYLQIAKYGFLHLCFSVDKSEFDCEFQWGKQLLRDLGFGTESAQALRDFSDDWEGFIPQMAEDVMKDKWHLMVFHQIEGDCNTGCELVQSIAKSNDLSRLPLPGTFVTVDACLTNSTLAWLSKHFYL